MVAKKWEKTKKREKELQSLVEKESITQTPCTFSDIKDAIISEESFGIVKCSISVPDELKPRFSEFPPIFKNSEIPISEIGEHMKEFCRSITREKGVVY